MRRPRRWASTRRSPQSPVVPVRPYLRARLAYRAAGRPGAPGEEPPRGPIPPRGGDPGPDRGPDPRLRPDPRQYRSETPAGPTPATAPIVREWSPRATRPSSRCWPRWSRTEADPLHLQPGRARLDPPGPCGPPMRPSSASSRPRIHGRHVRLYRDPEDRRGSKRLAGVARAFGSGTARSRWASDGIGPRDDSAGAARWIEAATRARPAARPRGVFHGALLRR